jgi:BirA family transcriptional regulator, biotin operon repressor / biotin---[acetyl-CoA-carboxylase] ligase
MSPPTPATDRLIERGRLDSLLDSAPSDWVIDIVDETGSTNTDLRERLKAERALARPLVRVAYLQNAGRGRRGRQWVAAAGDALMFSVAFRLARPLSALNGLSLAIGCAVLTGLRTLMPDQAERFALKWPNDILLDGAKLGGILIETAATSAADCTVVIGIGLNLRGAPELTHKLEQLAGAPLNRVAALDALAAPPMADVLAALLNALAPALEQFERDGFAVFAERWQADHAYAGQHVVLSENGVELASGIASGVDASGQLTIAQADGSLHLCAIGDVSLRLQARADGAPT